MKIALVHLRRAGSKNKKPYVIVLTGDLAAIIERRWTARSVTRPDDTTYLSEYVFHRDGRPIGDFGKAWATACAEAKLPGLLFRGMTSALRPHATWTAPDECARPWPCGSQATRQTPCEGATASWTKMTSSWH